MSAPDSVLARFLEPGYACDNATTAGWPASGLAETPGADARCRIFLACDGAGRLSARFAAFGPPPVIACADWLCGRVEGQTPDAAAALTAREVEKALALAPTQRYAGLMAIDALNSAMITLQGWRYRHDDI